MRRLCARAARGPGACRRRHHAGGSGRPGAGAPPADAAHPLAPPPAQWRAMRRWSGACAKAPRWTASGCATRWRACARLPCRASICASACRRRTRAVLAFLHHLGGRGRAAAPEHQEREGARRRVAPAPCRTAGRRAAADFRPPRRLSSGTVRHASAGAGDRRHRHHAGRGHAAGAGGEGGSGPAGAGPARGARRAIAGAVERGSRARRRAARSARATVPESGWRSARVAGRGRQAGRRRIRGLVRRCAGLCLQADRLHGRCAPLGAGRGRIAGRRPWRGVRLAFGDSSAPARAGGRPLVGLFRRHGCAGYVAPAGWHVAGAGRGAGPEPAGELPRRRVAPAAGPCAPGRWPICWTRRFRWARARC